MIGAAGDGSSRSRAAMVFCALARDELLGSRWFDSTGLVQASHVLVRRSEVAHLKYCVLTYPIARKR